MNKFQPHSNALSSVVQKPEGSCQYLQRPSALCLYRHRFPDFFTLLTKSHALQSISKIVAISYMNILSFVAYTKTIFHAIYSYKILFTFISLICIATTKFNLSQADISRNFLSFNERVITEKLLTHNSLSSEAHKELLVIMRGPHAAMNSKLKPHCQV